MTSRSLARNLVSEAGVVIALIALTNTAFLIYVDGTQKHANPYMGILAWIVAPAIFCFGLAVFILGLLLERRRRRRLAPDVIPEYPRLDLNHTRTRVIVAATTVALILFVTVSVVGSYQAYHYTDTDAFCGTLCHQVMKPEYTAYKLSPHARVGCVGCHVGPGAGWYVRSKLSGAYQLYSVVAKKYPKPIQSPVANLRPAQETCEQCHWPEKFWGAQLKTFEHFGYDEANTPHVVRMLIKTGGGSPTTGMTAGIHWHMNIANKVTYLATDRQRQVIPWVRIEDRNGNVTEYRTEDSKLTDAQIAAAPKRRMDCVDCHNRPTHIYVPPDRAVDAAIIAGRIDRTLPYVKQQAVAALAKDYATTDAAVAGIAKDIPEFYSKTYAQLYATNRKAVDQTVQAVQQIFQSTRFPEMHVDWRTHPNNIGHYLSAGCFRCHDDQHVSKDGKKISKDCTICHEMLTDTKTAAEFQHPIDLGDMRAVNCADCHNGGGM
jgi:hypothetical protein